MPTFTLEDLGKKVEEKFAPTKVDMGEAGTLVMRPLVQFTDDETAEIGKLQREINALQGAEDPVYVDADGKTREPTEEETAEWEAEQRKVRPLMLEKLADLIRITAGPAGREYADAFLALKGDDLGTLLVLVTEYGSSSQLGEASASPSS